ncbi:uncharacterized protein LOC135684118 [Rhopilema esculentum]|uniref:uncharacterized protein LOC135684118 n=1 Tax=Rhopilema esculentum TaxID=499914 RepID=UPI0031E15EB0
MAGMVKEKCEKQDSASKYISEEKILIQDLQNLKLNQLIQLEKYPVCSKQDVADRIKDIFHQEQSDQTIDTLKGLSSPSARLLGKLAIDVADNYKELANRTEKKLLNQIRRKHFLHGDNFLVDNVPVHPLLRQWYKELKVFSAKACKQNPDDYTLTALQDKEAFNIKYEPMCAKCRTLAGLSTSGNHHDTKEKSIASLSFSSCHLGYCCRVSVESACRLCLILSKNERPMANIWEWTEGDVTIRTEPAFCSDTQILLSSGQTTSASVFIHKQLWTFIQDLSKVS